MARERRLKVTKQTNRKRAARRKKYVWEGKKKMR
jgi:hypothetical protein